MDDFFSRRWHDLVGRMHGPMNLRRNLQPLVAGILAIRAALREARAGGSSLQ